MSALLVAADVEAWEPLWEQQEVGKLVAELIAISMDIIKMYDNKIIGIIRTALMFGSVKDLLDVRFIEVNIALVIESFETIIVQ